MNLFYLANVRFPSERAHASQIAHNCQAFAGKYTKVDLIVNKRVSVSLEEIQDSLGFVPKFLVTRIPPSFFSAKLKVFFYISELFFALNFLLAFRVRQQDVVYSRSEWIIYFLSFFIISEKLVWESHEAKYTFPAKKILKKGIRTVVISEGIFNTYKDLGVPSYQILVAHDAIDDSFFTEVESKESARMRLQLPRNKKIVMYIGGFDGWKGLDTLLEASTFVEDISLVVIGGSGEQVSQYKSKYPKVTFLGARPYSDLKNNQQAADLLVIPNSAKIVLSSHYTSPLKLFAHMASGVPLVMSQVPSITSVVPQNEANFFEPDNPTSLAKAIRETLLDKEGSKQKAALLYERAKSYTWNNRAKQIIQFIQK